MKKLTYFLVSIVLLCFTACKGADERDNCKEDQIDGKWQAVVDSSQCSDEDKGEAYLGLAGFNYFDLIRDAETKSITEILGLTLSNWATKLSQYQNATSSVRATYLSGSDKAKTVFFFGSFLSLYTEFSGNLDNGASGAATAFDGTITSDEVAEYTSVDLGPSGGDADITLTATTDYQIKSGGTYYIFEDATDTLFTDPEKSGVKSDGVNTNFNAAQVAAAVAAATEINQIAQVDKVVDPLAPAAGGPNNIVINFSAKLLGYLDDIQNALNALDVENDSELVKPIIEFRGNLDNGAQCTTLQNFPALGLANLFVANTQKTAIADYSAINTLDNDDITDLYPSFTTTKPAGVTATMGVRLVFLNAAGAAYIPYWDGAHANIKPAMTSLELIGTTDVEASDGKVSYAELICASELVTAN